METNILAHQDVENASCFLGIRESKELVAFSSVRNAREGLRIQEDMRLSDSQTREFSEIQTKQHQ